MDIDEMKIMDTKAKCIQADSGMVLTNGEAYSKEIYLGKFDSPETEALEIQTIKYTKSGEKKCYLQKRKNSHLRSTVCTAKSVPQRLKPQ